MNRDVSFRIDIKKYNKASSIAKRLAINSILNIGADI